MLLYIVMLLASVDCGACWTNEVYVSHNGSSEKSCGHWQTPCTFNSALKRLSNDTVLYLEPSLSYIHTDPTELRYMSNIAIMGCGHMASEVIVTCHDQAGFSFIHSEDITFNSVMLVGCGALRNSTTWDCKQSFLTYQVSLYFLFCYNVNMTNIDVMHSNGTGITLYNTVGHVIMNHLCLNSSAPTPYDYGGGGLQIEFSFCVPGNYDCPPNSVPPNYTRDALYIIKDSIFTKNNAYRGYSQPHRSNFGRDSYNFGKGGGISIIMKGNATQNNVTIFNCTIHDNKAHLGAGLFVKFNDRARHNIVSAIESSFSFNRNYDTKTDTWDFDACGGGSKLEYFYAGNITTSNSVHFLNCNFNSNTALSGGGIGVEVKSSLVKTEDILTVEHCNFQSNRGFLGSALFLQQTHVLGNSDGFVAHLSNCNFTKNVPVCLDFTSVQYFSSLPCTGIIYTISCPIDFSGKTVFTYNKATPIEVHYSFARFNFNSSIIFSQNHGKYGGAIALHDCAQMKINCTTKFNFSNNAATNEGGALYVGNCARSSILARNCFIQYTNSSAHPDDWDTSFVFYKNEANTTDNAIYAEDLSLCWWPNTTDITSELVPQNTFCWKHWKYESSNCKNSVKSGPAFLMSKNKGLVHVYPGDSISLPSVNDSRGYILNDVSFKVCVLSGSASVATNVNEGGTRCTTTDQKVLVLCQHNQGCTNENVSLMFETVDSVQPLQTATIATFKSCEWPYILKKQQHKCILAGNTFCCDEKCQEDCSFETKIWPNHGYCYSSQSDNESYVYGTCPLSYYYSAPTFLVNDIISYCHKINRAGRLCGHCAEGYGVPINSPYLECAECGSYGVLWFLLLEILPVTLMVVIILVFSVKLTSSFMYGFVFYCQIISINFPGWYYPVWFTNSESYNVILNKTYSKNLTLSTQLTFPFSIWNLNFMTIVPPSYTSICISNNMNPTGAILFWYIIALYPLIMMVCVYVWLKMYDRSYRMIVFVTRPFHQSIARFWQAFDIAPSIADSIASVYILCFTQIAATSLKLLHPTKWQSLEHENDSGIAFFYNAAMGYFHGIHILYGLVAIFMLIFIILLPSIFLTLYQFKFFLKVLEFIKIRKFVVISIFVDAFTSEFQNGTFGKRDFRYFAGLYLLLRVFIMLFFYIPYYRYETLLLLQTTTTIAVAGVIMIFRPYKKLRYTLLNFLLFLILSIISLLNYLIKSKPVFPPVVALMYLPIFGSVIYFSYWFSTKLIFICKSRCTVQYKPLVIPNMEASRQEYDDQLADRLLRPNAYNCTVSKLNTTDKETVLFSFPDNTSTDISTYTTDKSTSSTDISTSSTEPTHSTVSLNELVPEYGSIN